MNSITSNRQSPVVQVSTPAVSARPAAVIQSIARADGMDPAKRAAPTAAGVPVGIAKGSATAATVAKSMDACASAFGPGFTVSRNGNNFEVRDPKGESVFSMSLAGNTATVSVAGAPAGEFSLGARPSEAVALVAASVQAQREMPGHTVSFYSDWASGNPSASISAGHDGPDHQITVSGGQAHFNTSDLSGNVQHHGGMDLGKHPMTAISNALQVRNAAALIPGARVTVGNDSATGNPMAQLNTPDGQRYQFTTEGALKVSASRVTGGRNELLDGNISLRGRGHEEIEQFVRAGQIPGVDTGVEEVLSGQTEVALERRANELSRGGQKYEVTRSINEAGRTVLSLGRAGSEQSELSLEIHGGTARVTGPNGRIGDVELANPAITLAMLAAADRLGQGPVSSELYSRGYQEVRAGDASIGTDHSGSIYLRQGNGETTSFSPGMYGRTEMETGLLLAGINGGKAVDVSVDSQGNVFNYTAPNGVEYSFRAVAGGEVEVWNSEGASLPNLVLGEDATGDFNAYLSRNGIR